MSANQNLRKYVDGQCRGTQFGMLIHYFKTHHADILRAIKQENDFEGSNLDKINLLSFYEEARKNTM